MDRPCVPVDTDKVRAFWTADGVLIAASGTLPTPCWEVRIELSPIEVWPPEFVLSRCPTGGICIELVVPYSASEHFPFGTRPDSVVVHDASGRHSVEMEDIPTEVLAPEAEGDGVDEATGLSGNMSFDEAFQDALKKLPEWQSPTPDDMAVVTVTESGAWLGGLAGFHHSYVKVRRVRRKHA